MASSSGSTKLSVAPDGIIAEQLMNAIDDQEVRALVDQLGETARILHDVHVTFIEQAEQLLAAVEAELGD